MASEFSFLTGSTGWTRYCFTKSKNPDNPVNPVQLNEVSYKNEPECNRFTGTDAYGGAMGWAYEEGLEEGQWRRIEKEMAAKRRKRKRNNTEE